MIGGFDLEEIYGVKKIGRSNIVGEQGVALVRGVILSMGFIFYETGGVEAGIDGVIKLRDEDSGQVRNMILQGLCQGSRHHLWPSRARLGVGPPLTKGADADAVLGMRIGSRVRATRAHRPGLSPVPLSRV